MVEINSNDFGVTNGETYDSISMALPSKPEYVGVVRLTVSAIANRMGFNIEEIEDIKVAVAEACKSEISGTCAMMAKAAMLSTNFGRFSFTKR